MIFRRLFRVVTLCVVALAATFSHAQFQEVGDGTPGPVKAPHLTVELTSLSPQIASGGTVQAGLVMSIEEHWHVYWINAGDSGEPPAIKWTLPAGLTAAPLQFPIPSRLPLGPLMDFGYEDAVTFPATLTSAPGMKPGKVHLDAEPIQADGAKPLFRSQFLAGYDNRRVAFNRNHHVRRLGVRCHRQDFYLMQTPRRTAIISSKV